jgi:hypothetical protein
MQRFVHMCQVFLSVLFLIPGGLLAQSDLEKAIVQMNSAFAEGYVQPLADMVGANVNSGFFHSASIPTTGFSIEIALVSSGAVVSDDQKSYSSTAPAGFNPGTFTTSTLFGGQGTVVTDAGTGLQYKGTDGLLNTSMFPTVLPQLRIGSLMGTEAIIRYMPLPELGNGVLPASTQFGIGARHSISQYIPSLSFDIAAGVFYNSYKAGDIIEFNSVAVGAEASKQFGILTLYGGLQWENSTLNLKYTYTDPTTTATVVDLNLTGANSFRGTVGTALSLGVFQIFVDANLGSVTAFAGGLGLAF